MIKKFERRKEYSRFKERVFRFKENIWAADLAEMGSLSSQNRVAKYFLCVTHVFTKYTQVKPFNCFSNTVLNGFIEIVNESKRKPNKLWVDQGREFYTKLMQKQLDNDIYSS